MGDLQWYEIVLIGLVFVWSGFVRSGLGFGGAVLALPFLLLIVNDPLIFLPIIAVHLLIFSGWIALKAHYRKQHDGESSAAGGTIHWQYLRRALRVIIIPKILGVIGLLTLSPKLMSIIIFTIVLGYAIGYIINRPIRHQSKAVDIALLERWRLHQWHVAYGRSAADHRICRACAQTPVTRHLICAVVYSDLDKTHLLRDRWSGPPTHSSSLATPVCFGGPCAWRAASRKDSGIRDPHLF